MFWNSWLSATLVALAAPQHPPIAHHYFSKVPPEHAAHWSYAGKTGPLSWRKLDASYAACAGKHQSPIALKVESAASAAMPSLKFDYRSEKVGVVNNGHTIQHQGDPASHLFLGEKQFSLEQFHIHAPSEHTLGGRHFPLEVHFVHKSKAGEVLVVALLVKEDAKSSIPILLNLDKDLPSHAGEGVTLDGTRNPGEFLPKNLDYLSYSGSFTTPPCTEGVEWAVLKEPVGLKPDSIKRIAAIVKGNNRPLQALGDRAVRKSFGAASKQP